MSKSSLIAVLALIASVSAKPYYYGYNTLPYRAAYTAADVNPAAVAPQPFAYSSTYQTLYPAGSSAAYLGGYPYSTYPASYPAPFPGAYAAPLQLPAVSAYAVEEVAAVPAVAPVGPVAPVAPVAPLTYASPYSYLYKR